MAEERLHTYKRLVRALALALGLALVALPASSEAAFPGENGKLAFTNNLGGISVMNEADGVQTSLTDGSESDPAWSPDGQRLAFTSTPGGGDREIYVMYADGSGLTRLTSNLAEDAQPAWSPDGRRIAFSDHSNIYVVDADGSGGPTQLTNTGWLDYEPAWSPDGQRIAFTSGRDGDAEIYVMREDGSSEENLTQDPAFDREPAWSPDGQKIAFMREPASGYSEIFVMNANGVGPRPQRNVTNTLEEWEEDPNWQPLTTTITVKNALRPSTASVRLDLSVDSTAVRTAAGDGDAGTTIAGPGVHDVSVAATGGTSLAEYVTSIDCTKNGNPDVTGAGTSVNVDVAPLDAVVCTVTNTRGAPTPAGSNVVVSPADVTTGASPLTITFADVTADGVTTLSSSAAGPAPPSGFELDGAYYALETTASFTSAEVCFPYTGPTPSTILHWVNGTSEMEDITRDTGSEVCAEVTSFSPFALARSVGGDDADAPSVVCGSADGAWHAGNVSIDCTAEDTESGLADPADAAFALTTSVPPDEEDGDASTGSREVCDGAGNCETAGPIDGNKIDRRAPTLSLPSAKTVDATSPQRATVTFSASAADGADPDPGVSCAPASGSVFAIGTSNVACTATDHVGNTAVGSFTVTVRGAKEQLDRLIGEVIAASKLPPAVKTQLLAQLRTAIAQFDPSKPAQRKAACNTLTAFAGAVRLLSGRGLPPAQATQWIADANRIRAVIGC